MKKQGCAVASKEIRLVVYRRREPQTPCFFAQNKRSEVSLENKQSGASVSSQVSLESQRPNQTKPDHSKKLNHPKALLILGIIFNLCLLGIFKYTDFFLENFNLFTKLLALDFAIHLPHILLPLALSFVTFQQIAFLVDCYKQATERESAQNPAIQHKKSHISIS